MKLKNFEFSGFFPMLTNQFFSIFLKKFFSKSNRSIHLLLVQNIKIKLDIILSFYLKKGQKLEIYNRPNSYLFQCNI